MKRLATVVVVALAAAMTTVVWDAGKSEPPPPPPPAATSAWAQLDAPARCASATALVTHRDRWPTVCRWREPGGVFQGQSFPPPIGPPPYDDPHIEIYVAPSQTREQLASVIAHELGHMHLTRDPAFVPEWLTARNLAADTTSDVWVEDYAEVFATLFGPSYDRWRAPTTRPGPDELARLRARFFA